MTPAQFKAARLALRLTQRQFATALNLGKDGGRSVRRYESGGRAISGPLALAVEYLLTQAGLPPQV